MKFIMKGMSRSFPLSFSKKKKNTHAYVIIIPGLITHFHHKICWWSTNLRQFEQEHARHYKKLMDMSKRNNNKVNQHFILRRNNIMKSQAKKYAHSQSTKLLLNYHYKIFNMHWWVLATTIYLHLTAYFSFEKMIFHYETTMVEQNNISRFQSQTNKMKMPKCSRW